jgi:uracil phosphoribosyltransferase
MICNLSESDSVLNHFIAELRDKHLQTDSMRFRRNLERVGEIIAYEISKTLTYHPNVIETPLDKANARLIKDKIVIGSILRAGIPLHQGLLNYFDKAENAFISAYRKNNEKQGDFEIELGYLASPNLKNKCLILSDPMIATGRSLVKVYNQIIEAKGKADILHISCAIASKAGLDYVRQNISDISGIWCAAIDEELTSKYYISPGLGDAGDLAFGIKS